MSSHLAQELAYLKESSDFHILNPLRTHTLCGIPYDYHDLEWMRMTASASDVDSMRRRLCAGCENPNSKSPPVE